MFNYENVKKQVKAQLAEVNYFEVKFTNTSTCTAFKFVKPGSTRKFTRISDKHFQMGKGREVIGAASIAHVVAHKEGQLSIS